MMIQEMTSQPMSSPALTLMPKLKKGDLFQMPIGLPIGKDGRKVKRMCVCQVTSARQKGLSYYFTYTGRCTDKTRVKIDGYSTIPYTRLEKLLTGSR